MSVKIALNLSIAAKSHFQSAVAEMLLSAEQTSAIHPRYEKLHFLDIPPVSDQT